MLHWAAHNDYQRMAVLLISNGANLEAKDEVLLLLMPILIILLTCSCCLYSIPYCRRIWLG